MRMVIVSYIVDVTQCFFFCFWILSGIRSFILAELIISVLHFCQQCKEFNNRETLRRRFTRNNLKKCDDHIVF